MRARTHACRIIRPTPACRIIRCVPGRGSSQGAAGDAGGARLATGSSGTQHAAHVISRKVKRADDVAQAAGIAGDKGPVSGVRRKGMQFCDHPAIEHTHARSTGVRHAPPRHPVRPKRVRAPSLSASAFQVGVVKTLDGRGAAPAAPHPALDRQACQAGADCGRGNGPSRVHHLAVRALPPRGCRARRHVPHIRAPLCRPCLYTRASRAGSCRWALRAGFRVPPPRRGRPLLKAAVHARRPPACTHTVPPLLCLDNGIFFLEKQRKVQFGLQTGENFPILRPLSLLNIFRPGLLGRGRATRGQEQTMIRGNTVVSQARAEVCADVRARHGARLGGAVCICGGA